MDLKSYLAILKGNIWVVMTTFVVTVAVVTIISFATTPTYTASTTLRVATASTGNIDYSDYIYADRLLNTYIRLATSSPVLDELASKLNLQKAPATKVETIPNTELIKISIDSQDPSVAQNAADSLSQILIDQGRELYSGGGQSALEILSEQLAQADEELNLARQEYDTYLLQPGSDKEKASNMEVAIQLKEKTYATLLDQYDQARLKEIERKNMITVVEPAEFPITPSKPNKLLNISLGSVIGLVGGVGLAFLFENLFGSRLYSSKQIEAVTELNTIGKIPTIEKKRMVGFKRKKGERYFFPFNEAFRRLHVQILIQNSRLPSRYSNKIFMITSSEPSEGKSTITANLAIAIAQSGKNVIIIDCDLHIPKQHKIFGLSNTIGLSNILSDKESDKSGTVQKTKYNGLFVITSGPMSKSNTKLLGSEKMTELIQSLENDFDIILLDTPAFLAVADSAQLAPIVDGVVLVVRRNYIREDALREACRQLKDINARVVGLVVNEAERNGTYYYYGHK